MCPKAVVSGKGGKTSVLLNATSAFEDRDIVVLSPKAFRTEDTFLA